MLTMERPALAEPAGLVQHAYWTEALGFHAHPLGDLGGVFNLGNHPAATPRLAMRWLHRRAIEIAEQMPPESAWRIVDWIRSPGQLEAALTAIASSGSYLTTFIDSEDGAHYALSVRRIIAPTVTSPLARLEPVPPQCSSTRCPAEGRRRHGGRHRG